MATLALALVLPAKAFWRMARRVWPRGAEMKKPAHTFSRARGRQRAWFWWRLKVSPHGRLLGAGSRQA